MIELSDCSWSVSDDYELADGELMAVALDVGPACIDRDTNPAPAESAQTR
ncbi:MAG TPA: hypothetical protein VNU19_09305 [Candidatus Acidoferrum sp.]|nr:hypothetical protein [Candidatus Acidoferrum sp.]